MDDKHAAQANPSSDPTDPRDRERTEEREPQPRAAQPEPWSTTRRAMARKKVSTTVYIEPEQADRLKLLHERTKVPVAVYIREGIELALAKYEHLLPGQLPLDAAKRPPQT